MQALVEDYFVQPFEDIYDDINGKGYRVRFNELTSPRDIKS